MPAATRKIQDLYGNRAFTSVTMSAANTLTFNQIQFGVGLFQGVAMVISKIEWYPSVAAIRELVAVADDLSFALTNRDDLTSLAPTNQSVLAFKNIIPMMVGAVVGLQYIEFPYVSDFSMISGGGLILPANPLYIACLSAGFAAAATLRAILYFTFKQLSDAEYIELMQTIMPANI